MLNVKTKGVLNMGNEINVTVHVGNLETIINISLDELERDNEHLILEILQNHINNMDTSSLIQKLAK